MTFQPELLALPDRCCTWWVPRSGDDEAAGEPCGAPGRWELRRDRRLVLCGDHLLAAYECDPETYPVDAFDRVPSEEAVDP